MDTVVSRKGLREASTHAGQGLEGRGTGEGIQILRGACTDFDHGVQQGLFSVETWDGKVEARRPDRKVGSRVEECLSAKDLQRQGVCWNSGLLSWTLEWG